VVYGPGQAHPPLSAVPPGSGFTGVNPAWLAGSADRERTVGVLRAAFTEGRLNQDELDDRVARVYAARTYCDLWALIADLPAGPLPYPGGLPYQQATPVVPPSRDTPRLATGRRPRDRRTGSPGGSCCPRRRASS